MPQLTPQYNNSQPKHSLSNVPQYSYVNFYHIIIISKCQNSSSKLYHTNLSTYATHDTNQLKQHRYLDTFHLYSHQIEPKHKFQSHSLIYIDNN